MPDIPCPSELARGRLERANHAGRLVGRLIIEHQAAYDNLAFCDRWSRCEVVIARNHLAQSRQQRQLARTTELRTRRTAARVHLDEPRVDRVFYDPLGAR